MPNENLKNLWNTLKNSGYNPPEYDTFSKDMENEDNLRGAYETLKKEGYTPPEFDVFKSDMGYVPAQSEPQQPAHTPVVPTIKDTTTIRKEQEEPVHIAESVKVVRPNIEVEPIATDYQAQQFEEQQKIETQTREQVADLSSQVDSLLNEKMGEQIAKRVENNENARKGGFWSNLAYAISQSGGSPTGPTGGTGSPMPVDQKDIELEGEVASYKAAKRALTQAERIIEEADHNELNYDTWLEQTFVGGAVRGFGKHLFDVENWDMGGADLSDASSLMIALNKFDNGEELTQAEQTLLDAKAVELATNAYFGSYVGRGYKAGRVTAESIPFMLEMCINPASSMGTTAQSKITRYALKRFGKKAVKDNSKKMAAAKVTSRIIGDAAGAMTMAGTTGAIGVTADAASRMNGNVLFDTDDEGNSFFAGHLEGEDAGAAFRKAFLSRAIENHSEMLGNYFAPVFKGARVGLDKVTHGKVGMFLNDVASTDLGKIITDFEKHAQWNGTVSEYVEEVLGNVENAILVGDMQFGTEEGEIFNLSDNIDTFLGVALMGGAFSSLKTLGYLYDKAEKYKLSNRVATADVAAAAAFDNPEEWEDLKDVIHNRPEELYSRIEALLNDEDTPIERKKAVLDFISAEQALEGANMVDMKRHSEGDVDPLIIEIEDSFDGGYALHTEQEMNDAKNNFEFMQNQLRTVLNMDDITLEELAQGTGILFNEDLPFSEQEKHVIVDYLNAKNTYEGMIQHVRDDIDSQIAAVNSTVDSNVNLESRQIVSATMKMDDRKVYIVGGNVQMTEDGTMVDSEKSDESIIIRDAETGKVEFSHPGAVLKVDDAVDPDTMKESLAQEIRNKVAREAADKIDGILPFALGDEYTLTDLNGVTFSVQIVANEQGIVDNGDGTVNVILNPTNEASKVVPMSKEEIQNLSDTNNLVRLAEYQKQRAEQKAQKKAEEIEAAMPIYKQDDEVTLNTPNGRMRGTITANQNEDGQFEVFTEAPINGKKVNLFTPEELNAMILEQNGNPVVVPAEPVAKVTEEAPIEAPVVEEVVDNRTALERIPVNEAGEQDFEKAPVEDTFNALVEIAEGNEEDAIDTALQMAENAKKELEKAKKAKPKGGATVFDIQKNKNAAKANIQKWTDSVSYWEKVAGLREAQKRAEEENARLQKKLKLAKAREEQRKNGRYGKINSQLGDPIDFRDYVMRSIANGSTTFKWASDKNNSAIKGLGAHLGFNNSPSERMKRIWMLSNENGMYPEAAAEALLLAYAEDMGIDIDQTGMTTMDAFNEMLDVLLSFDSSRAMMDEAVSRHRQLSPEAMEEYYNSQIPDDAEVQEDAPAFVEEQESYPYEISEEDKADVLEALTQMQGNPQLLEALTPEDQAAFANAYRAWRALNETFGDVAMEQEENLKSSDKNVRKQAEAVVKQAEDAAYSAFAPIEAMYAEMTQRYGIPAEVIDIEADPIEQARNEVNTDPTEGQKKAGNYKMGHVTIDGHNITLENPKGSIRKGKDASGKEWQTEMKNDYGYIRGTQSIDGDHIDVFLSDNPSEGNVYVVDQVNPETGKFDEHKVMYGFNSVEEAQQAYLSNYEEGWRGLGPITPVTKEEFKKWIDSSTRKTKPFSEYKRISHIVDQIPDADKRNNLSKFNEGDVVLDYYDKKLYRIKSHGKNGVSLIAELDAEGNEVATSPMNTNNNARYSLAEAPVKAEEPAEKEKKPKKSTRTKKAKQGTENKTIGEIVPDITLTEDAATITARLAELGELIRKYGFENVKYYELENDNDRRAKIVDAFKMFFPEFKKIHTGDWLIDNSLKNWVDWVESHNHFDSVFHIEQVLDRIKELTDIKPINQEAHSNLSRFHTAYKKTMFGVENKAKQQYKEEYEKINEEWKAFLKKCSPEELAAITEYAEAISAYVAADRARDEFYYQTVTPELVEEIKQKYSEGKSAEKIASEIQQKGNFRYYGNAKRVVNNIINKLPPVAVAPAEEKPATPEYGSQNKLVSNERYEQLKAKMKDKLSNLNAGVDPEMLAIGCEMAMYHIEAGAHKFIDYSKAMINDLGDAIRPYLKAFYNGARDLPGMEDLSDSMDEYKDVKNFDVDSISIEPEIKEEKAESDAPVMRQVDVFGLFDALNKKGEAKLSDHFIEESVPKTEESVPKQEESVPESKESVPNLIGSVTKDKHTKTGEDLWVVKAKERVSTSEFAELKRRAKANGGYWSSFKKGFIFNSEEEANKFNNPNSLDDVTQETTEQTAADTEVIVNKGESVARKAVSVAEASEVSAEQVEEQIQNIDDALEEVNEQLALLGYYEADIDDSVFNESYGYMKSAEKKAVKDADKLAKKLAKDLGIEVGKGRLAKANIAPAGGSITFSLPLNEGRELYFDIAVEPEYQDGGSYGDNLSAFRMMYRVENPAARDFGINMFAGPDITYKQLLDNVRGVARGYLPEVSRPTLFDLAESIATEAQEAKKKGKKIVSSPKNDDFVGTLFADLTPEEEDADAKEPAPTQKVTEINGYKIGDKVLYRRPFGDKKEVLQIVDFDGGRPVLDAFGVNWISELAEWSNIEPYVEPTNTETNDISTGSTDQNGAVGEGNREETQRTDNGSVDRDNSDNPSDNEAGSTRAADKPVKQVSNKPAEKKNTRNNRVERGASYAPTTTSQRISANIDAIKLMKKLVEEDKPATKEDMAVLRQYSGWGGLGDAFNELSYRNKELRSLLTEEEYEAAEGSRRSAYFTPVEVIDTMWDIARKLGFSGGKVLEGSAGVGNIIASMPKALSQASDITAVEIDTVTGNILKLLYPDADVQIKGFEDVRIDNNSVDLAITNVPFITGANVFDEVERDLSRKFRSIHDFCIAKNVRKLKEGGLGIFITSNGTLDKSRVLRQWIVNEGKADVIGAFRLNNDTFGGTDATSDIIIIRKRVNNIPSPNAIDVLGTTVAYRKDYTYIDRNDRYKEKTETVAMEYNSYFIEHPEFLGGEMKFAFEHNPKETYRPKSIGCYAVPDNPQQKALNKWARGLRNDAEPAKVESKDDQSTGNEEATSTKEGQLIANSKGELCLSLGGKAVSIGVNSNKVKGRTKAECLKDYDAIKDALNAVLDYQTKNENDKGLEPLLETLNKAYDTFVERYGSLNKNKATPFLKNDVDFASIAAIEDFEEIISKDGKVTIKTKKTDVFKKRMIGHHVEPTPKTAKDGVIISMNLYGRINLPFIAEKLGKDEETVKEEILADDLAFENPMTSELEVRYKYLSGNVREKLAYAKMNNEGGKFNKNISELEKVIPMDIPAHLIEFTLGSSWIDKALFERYAIEKYGIPAEFKLAHIGNVWKITAPYWGFNTEQNKAAGVRSDKVGKTVLGHELMLSAMNNTIIQFTKKIKHSDDSTETIVDKEAGEAATARMMEIREDFKEWAKDYMLNNVELSELMKRAYNDAFNNYAPMEIDDIFLPERFEGSVLEMGGRPFSLYRHQKSAVIRGTMEPLMLAHEVGSGKTFTLISTAMEMRRLGTAQKPMIVVQNATVGQFVSSAKALYPSAKILTISSKDMKAEGRQTFYAKIKYNDWDMIIVPQSVFERIPDSEERKLAYIQEKIDEKLHILEEAKAASADSETIRQLEKELSELQVEYNTGESPAKKKKTDKKKTITAIENTTVRAKEQLERQTDDTSDFDDMGIDALLIDEAHAYKHLGFTTSMKRGVKGVDSGSSKKAASLYLKTRSVFDKKGWKNVVFATGTPISNTAAEIWTFMKFLMPKEVMEAYKMYFFDDFVRNFGNIAQSLEFTTSGKFKENTRFAAYNNLPELVRIWSSVCDTVLTKDAVAAGGGTIKDKLPEMETGKAIDLFLPQSDTLIGIMAGVRAELSRFENMSGKEKREKSYIPLTMYGIAKRAAIDPRLVQEGATDENVSKTNKAVEEILKDLKETESYKGTCAIFCDNYRRLETINDKKVEVFNLFEDMKSKLIEAGVPESQIVVMRGDMSVAKKEKIFDDVNAGVVRVIFGSTQTLGTGVNIQERLHLLIHMDAPDRPMDYTQRNGRILRQGNMHKNWDSTVKVIRFGVEDSLDVTSYQRLKTKANFIDSVMDSKPLMSNAMNNRTLEEDEEGLFDNPVAVLSGSQYAMLKSQAEREYRKYLNKQKQHDLDQIYVENQLKDNKTSITNSHRFIEDYKDELQQIKATFPEGKPKAMTINGKTARESGMSTLFKEEVEDRLKTRINDARNIGYFPNEGQKVQFKVTVDGIDFLITSIINREQKWNYEKSKWDFTMHKHNSISCDKLHISSISLPADIKSAFNLIMDKIVPGLHAEEGIVRHTNKIERLTKDNEILAERRGKAFSETDKLKEAKARVDEYTELMRKELEEKEKKYAERDVKAIDIESLSTEEDDIENDENRYRKAYHGTSAVFDKFDHEHIGEGEGVQAHGWGTYIAFGEETSEAYAWNVSIKSAINSGLLDKEIMDDVYEDVFDSYTEMADNYDRMLEKAKEDVLDEIDSLKESVQESSSEEYRKRANRIIGRNEERYAKLQSYKPMSEVLEGMRGLYSVEIPEDNGSNYLEENRIRTDEEKKMLLDEIEKELVKEGIDLNDKGDYLRSWNDLKKDFEGRCADKFIYDSIAMLYQGTHDITFKESQKAASKLFANIGIVGMKYDGKQDGPCAVMFDTNAITITNIERFRIRTKPAPEKTGIGYKVFVLKDGKLYPPKVANPNGAATPTGIWLDADEGERAQDSKTGRPQVKSGGKGTDGGSGTLAYRPGWHLGEIPYALQFNRMDSETGERELFPANFVWAEVEYAADVDYQEEAMSYGYNKNGKFQHSYAGLPRVPENGSYKYRTNPNPATDPWIITGAMRVKRLLTPTEVDEMVREAGREPQRRQEGAITDEQIQKLNKEIIAENNNDAAAMEREAVEFAESLGVKANIIHDIDEIQESSARRRARKRGSKGWLNTDTGEVIVILPNAESVADVRATILHEIVGHKGMRELVGNDNYDRFLHKVYTAASKETRQRIMKLAESNNWNHLLATEEYIAGLAEDMREEEKTLWQKIRQFFMDMLHAAKIALGMNINDADLRYMLWRSYHLQKSKGALGVAEDITMQYKLGVGDFKNKNSKFADHENTNRKGRGSSQGEQGSGNGNGNDGRTGRNVRIGMAEHASAALAGKIGRSNLGLLAQELSNLSEGTAEMAGSDASYDERSRQEAVESALVRIAKEHGFFIPWKEAQQSGQKVGGHSKESIVYLSPDQKTIIKLKDPFAARAIKGNNPTDIIRELLVHNELFPDTAYTILGITEDHVGNMRFVLSQDFVQAERNATPKDIEAYLNERGLDDIGRFEFSNGEITILDAFADNVLVDTEGKLRFIDPIVKIRETGDNLRYRSKSYSSAQEQYNDRVRVTTEGGEKRKTANLLHRLLEAYQDSMLSLKELQDAIAKETGNPIEDNENAYMAENRMSSMNKAQNDIYSRDFYKPLQKVVTELLREGVTYDDLKKYLIAKHGLERNLVFSKREAEKDGGVWDGSVSRDFSGLSSLFEGATDFTAEAESFVNDFESAHNTDALWNRINAATKETLRKNYECGLMSKETYEKVRDMFKNYVPLRGWDSDVASDEFEYLLSGNRLISPTLKTAEGRTSIADDPIATIGHMAQSAISQGNRNLMKQKLLNLALNHPTSLISVSEQWYVKDAATGEWHPRNPVIPEDATPDEISDILKKFESDMATAQAAGNATKRRGGLNLAKHITVYEGQEHVVRVRRGGKEYCLYINGNPRAAQAVNGLTNPDSNNGAIKQAAMAVKNFMAQMFTSKNPAFIITNLSRDVLWAGTAVAMKENASYAKKYYANLGAALGKAKLIGLLSKFNKGTLDNSVEIEKYFEEFIRNGGETGFTQLNTVEDFKRDMKRFLRDAERNGFTALPAKAWRKIWDGVEFMNRCAEDTTRFMVYMTSRQVGRSVARSIYDAKEITVNFNKKGSGGYLNTAMNFAYIFFNATVQSIANFGKLMANNPKKMTAGLSFFALAGMLTPLLSFAVKSMFGGDDDDDQSYWDLPEWVRRNNLVFAIPWSDNGYITIPLPHELRPFYGMGELALSCLMGKEDVEDAIKKGAAGFSTMFPLDFTGNAGNAAINFTPTIAQPIAQLVANTDYFGKPIYRRNDYNKMDPEWTKAYKGTNAVVVNGAKWLNEVTGGNNVKKGTIDLNPAAIEHLYESYLGGVGKTLNRGAKTISMLWDEDMRQWRNVPVASSFIQQADERTSGSQLNREYFDYRDEHDKVEHELSGYRKQIKMGAMEYAEVLSDFMQTEEFLRYKKLHGYVNAISKLNSALKYSDDMRREELEAKMTELKQALVDELHEEESNK